MVQEALKARAFGAQDSWPNLVKTRIRQNEAKGG
jgi:hypothetical protein